MTTKYKDALARTEDGMALRKTLLADYESRDSAPKSQIASYKRQIKIDETIKTLLQDKIDGGCPSCKTVFTDSTKRAFRKCPVCYSMPDRGKWQPIETYYSDMGMVWFFEPHEAGGYQFAGAPNSDGDIANNLDGEVQSPTHWRPKPENPKEANDV
tara:strand:- start:5465 stop:5932 length:468 start_codon:yes stop_codon:yes gene_type:complete